MAAPQTPVAGPTATLRQLLLLLLLLLPTFGMLLQLDVATALPAAATSRSMPAAATPHSMQADATPHSMPAPRPGDARVGEVETHPPGNNAAQTPGERGTPALHDAVDGWNRPSVSAVPVVDLGGQWEVSAWAGPGLANVSAGVGAIVPGGK